MKIFGLGLIFRLQTAVYIAIFFYWIQWYFRLLFIYITLYQKWNGFCRICVLGFYLSATQAFPFKNHYSVYSYFGIFMIWINCGLIVPHTYRPMILSNIASGNGLLSSQHQAIFSTHWGRAKMATNFLTTISNAFSSVKIYKFRLRFCWNLFPRVQLTIFQQAWCWPGNKPLSEPMMVNLLMHICITRPQWVNTLKLEPSGSHFADNIFKRIFLKEKFCVLIQISLRFVLWDPMDNPSAWFRQWPVRWTGHDTKWYI